MRTGGVLLLIASLAAALRPAPAGADCGSIPFKGAARVFEPNQRALIAWNGREEILILSTDLRASEPTKVLEVIPLPAKPGVRKGDVLVLKEAVALINRKLYERARRNYDKSARGLFSEDGGPPKAPAGELTFHRKIGATDVSVTHVLKPAGFVEWVEKHLKSLRVARPTIPTPMKQVVREYLADGYTWFVFNVVSLGTKTRTKQAIEYRFKSDRIYFPLRITRTDAGRTTVSLLVLTRGLVGQHTFTGVPRTDVQLEHEPVHFTSKELIRLHVDVYKLLGRPRKAKARIWTIEGELASFTKDLLAGRDAEFRLRRDATGKVYGPFAYAPNAEIRLDGARYTLQPSESDVFGPRLDFRVEGPGRAGPVVPFEFENGQAVRLGPRRYTVLKKRPVASGR